MTERQTKVNKTLRRKQKSNKYRGELRCSENGNQFLLVVSVVLLQNPVTKHIPSDAMNKVRKGFDYNKRKISLVICFSRICYYILDHFLQVKKNLKLIVVRQRK